jgi:alkanesulfonate monooxygenase SsuD/methylene tetrahydromethanopterin reductase-like flavin-dependent oxidoreductase (luciferase family)
LVDVPFDERARLFDHHLRALVRILRGSEPGPHAGDPAVDRARRTGIPLVSAAMSRGAVRRAAELGIGIIGSSLLTVERAVEHVREYRRAGGSEPNVMIVRVWVGEPPIELMEQQFAEYRNASGGTAPVGRAAEGLLFGDASDVASQLLTAVTAGEADALNIRVHIAGLAPERAREQIEIVGREVLPPVRARWARGEEARA